MRRSSARMFANGKVDGIWNQRRCDVSGERGERVAADAEWRTSTRSSSVGAIVEGGDVTGSCLAIPAARFPVPHARGFQAGHASQMMPNDFGSSEAARGRA
jgi:hypothetical protein